MRSSFALIMGGLSQNPSVVIAIEVLTVIYFDVPRLIVPKASTTLQWCLQVFQTLESPHVKPYRPIIFDIFSLHSAEYSIVVHAAERVNDWKIVVNHAGSKDTPILDLAHLI